MSAPLSWSLPGGVALAYSAAADGDVRERERRTAWLARAGCPWPCAVARQVHGALIAEADPARLAEADGLVTGDPRLALAVFGADCPGLALVAADALGVAHCGWRGTAAGIVAALVQALAQRSAAPPATWQAFIGPGIAGARYEVDAPVLSARAWPPAALTPTRPGHARLDLATAIADDLAQLGIGDIRQSGVCTAADAALRSHRRGDRGAVQALAVWRA
jgi:hypothetical protein